MSANFVSVLKNIYEKSALPTAVADREFRFIWKNRAFGALYGDNDSLLSLFGGKIPESGLENVILDGSLCTFNILKAEETDGRSLYYIAELVRSESMADILNSSAIRDYISYICAKIKDAAGMISNSADEIYDAVSCGLYDGQMIVSSLNTIDESIMSVAKEVIKPEHFYYLMDKSEKEITLSADREIQRIVNAVEKGFGKEVRVTKSIDRSIYFRMDRSTFELMLAGMTEKCCGTKYFPEILSYSINKTGRGRAELSVKSVSPEGRPNTIRMPRLLDAELRNIKTDLFFEYICDILCERSGAVFTKAEIEGGYLFKMEFDIISTEKPRIEMTPTDYFAGRFGTVPLMFADLPVTKRYKYYDIDAYDEEEAEEISVSGDQSYDRK